MMKRYYYDLHVHSCLSPCGDDDSTPNNIAGMARLCELDIVALTDHNSCKNCPAFFEAADKLGVIPVAGMELTTSEDIHAVCLFEKLSDAMAFDEYVDGHRLRIKNRPAIFGEQLVLDGEDNLVGKEEYLLINATEISIDEVCSLVEKYNGVCYPAHIDRASNGIVAILGAIPREVGFRLFEIRDPERIKELCALHGIDEDKIIVSSDAHRLEALRDKDAFVLLPESTDPDEVRRSLFRYLRGEE